MTVIAGLVDGSAVWMGGDSALSNMQSHELVAMSTPKVFRVGPYLIGVCGSARVADVLRYALEVPRQTRRIDPSRFMRTTFINAVRDSFRKAGLFHKDGIEDIDAAFLVGYRGRLYTVEDDLHIHECVDDYAAVGSGASTALGALAVSGEVAPRKRLINAMTAAERYIASVRRPFYVLTLDA